MLVSPNFSHLSNTSIALLTRYASRRSNEQVNAIPLTHTKKLSFAHTIIFFHYGIVIFCFVFFFKAQFVTHYISCNTTLIYPNSVVRRCCYPFLSSYPSRSRHTIPIICQAIPLRHCSFILIALHPFKHYDRLPQSPRPSSIIMSYYHYVAS